VGVGGTGAFWRVSGRKRGNAEKRNVGCLLKKGGKDDERKKDRGGSVRSSSSGIGPFAKNESNTGCKKKKKAPT